MSHPTASDLVTYMAEAGVSVSNARAAQELGAVIAEFESLTGWVPFVGTTATQARLYDPPFGIAGRYVLRLAGGIWSDAGLSVEFYDRDGTWSLVEAAAYDVVLLTPSLPSPIVAIEFFRLPSYPRDSIRVTGRVGYSNACPPDVFQGLLDYAGARIRQHLALSGGGGTSEIKLLDMTLKTGYTISEQVHASGAAFRDLVCRYARYY